jgi:cytochrome P450
MTSNTHVDSPDDEATYWPTTDILGAGRQARAPLTSFAEHNALREAGPAHMLPGGHVIYTRLDDIREIAQRSDVFHSKAYDPVTGGPAEFTLVPQAIDGPMHGKWRRLLGQPFSPASVTRFEQSARARVNELIDGFIDAGKCDFINDFSLRFPTSVFVTHVMGLPLGELDRLLEWETDILHPTDADPGAAYRRSVAAQTEVTEYFAEIIAERRRMAPEDRGDDLISRAMSWQIDGEYVDDRDLLSFYLLMFEAGLDTVTAELGYAFHHLASHPADRERIVADPALIPNAVEELLRYYPIVNTGRTAMQDTEINGCPVKAGQRFRFSLTAAGRDPEQFQDADRVDFDREEISHITFGVGPHRCLGSHLARLELVIAFEEWHRRIPEYRIEAGHPYDESQGGLLGLNSLPLAWDVP